MKKLRIDHDEAPPNPDYDNAASQWSHTRDHLAEAHYRIKQAYAVMPHDHLALVATRDVLSALGALIEHADTSLADATFNHQESKRH